MGAHARAATARHERQTSKGFARDASRDTRHATDRVGLHRMRRGWRLAVGSARRARCSACVRRAACAARVAAACALSDHGPCHRGRTGQRASFTCDDARIRTRGPVSRVCGGASESRQTHRATWTRGRVALSVEQTHMASSMRRDCAAHYIRTTSRDVDYSCLTVTRRATPGTAPSYSALSTRLDPQDKSMRQTSRVI